VWFDDTERAVLVVGSGLSKNKSTFTMASLEKIKLIYLYAERGASLPWQAFLVPS
jgi:hypothetical protein